MDIEPIVPKQLKVLCKKYFLISKNYCLKKLCLNDSQQVSQYFIILDDV